MEAKTIDIMSLITYQVIHIMLGVFLFVLLVPVIKLLRRTGHHPLWCLLAIFPGLNAIAFWFCAFKPWPTEKKSANIGN